ncbi:MAG TPA: branched-chain amino acid ABC transporter permease [Chloroflexota bacterium]|nr:branched-chain amino acid ABC transporter permease [Chloroflexota bacterium]
MGAILTAGLYAVMSYGLALIYGVMKLINLSHAGTMMFGAFITLTLNRAFHLDPVLGSLIVLPLFFGFGMALYATIVRRIARSAPIVSLLLLFGLWLVLQNVAYLIWGNEDQSIVTAYTYSTIKIGFLSLAVTRVIVFAAGLAALAVLAWFISRTYTGKAVRAVSLNYEAARLAGINVERIAALSFGLGTGLAAFAGSLLTLLFSFTPDFGGLFQTKAFCVIVLGGLTSFVGVAIGSLLLALVESFGVLFMRASLQNLIAFGLLFVALVFMPGGLMSLVKARRA